MQEQLVHIQITPPNAGNPDIEFDEANMQQLSEFLDQNNLPEVFQQVFAVGSVNDIGGGSSVAPNIQSFFPTTVAGGVRDTLTIVGSDFGNSPDGIRPPNDKRLLFTPAPETFPPNYFWSTPINSPTQYISWSDDTIRVIVPSIARDVNNPTYAGGVVTDAASSELIGILDLSTPQPTIAQSNSSLYVRYSAVNQGFVNQGNEHVARAKLGNENGAGGYDSYYSPSFDTLKGGQAKAAFERALVTWRCNTLVNFRIQNFNGVPPANACLIDFGALQAGVSQTLKATTEYAPFNFCGGVIADNSMFENLTNFTITFSNNVNWHCDVTQPALNFNTDIDLETAALHEIGHAHLLWHTNNPANVMYFAATGYKRALTNNDLEGGNAIVSYSSVVPNPVCVNYSQMIPINQADCQNPTSTKNIEKIEEHFIIAPNPTAGSLRLIFKDNHHNHKINKLEIFDLNGRSVYIDRPNTYTSDFDISHLPKGQYFLIVYSDDKIFTGKIVKL